MMTMEQFEEEKARLMALYGHEARTASAKRAQAFARLYVTSGWTVRSLAEIERFSHTRINQLVHFGQFLMYLETQGLQGLDMHEKQFRMLWNARDKTHIEDTIFAAILQQWEEKTSNGSQIARTKKLSKRLISQFNDGKYHRLRDMAEALDVDMSAIRSLCDRIVSQGTFQTFGERRPAPHKEGSYAYRFVKGGKKKIDLAAFYAEAKPVLDEMANVINGHSVHFSQQLMKVTFTKFLQVIDRVVR